MTLSELTVGRNAIIEGFTKNTSYNDRLIALGVKKNKGVKVIRKSKFNGPIHIEIGTTQLMLRNLVAEQIKISHL